MPFYSHSYVIVGGPAAVLALHIVLTFFGVYSFLPDTDAIMHVLGGFAFGLSAGGLIWHARALGEIQYEGRAPQVVIVLGMVGLAAIGWEVFEFACDTWLGTRSQLSIADTMKDQVLGIVGGGMSTLLMRRAVK
jgi:hypothetical protein